MICETARDHLREMLNVKGRRACDVGRPCRLGDAARVEWTVDRPVGRGRCHLARRRCGRGLPARHAVDVVVEEYDGEIDVAPTAVQEVVAADGGAVAVSCNDDDVQLGTCELDSRCKWNRAPVRRVYSVKVHIARAA